MAYQVCLGIVQITLLPFYKWKGLMSSKLAVRVAMKYVYLEREDILCFDVKFSSKTQKYLQCFAFLKNFQNNFFLKFKITPLLH